MKWLNRMVQVGGLWFALAVGGALPADTVVPGPAVADGWFGLRFVDKETGEGIPLVFAKTVNEMRFVSDNNGWVAFREPGLMEREVWFSVESPGYERLADGFGIRGVRVKTMAGQSQVVPLVRKQLAQRVARLTGQGLYRDSLLLGQKAGGFSHTPPEVVLGQDSIQAVPWKDGIFSLWGDTNLAGYPLGLFQMVGAFSQERSGDGRTGIRYDYIVDKQDATKLRKMMPLQEPGVVWLSGLVAAEHPDNGAVLLAHYSRREGLEKELEHGLALFDEKTGVFDRLEVLPAENTWAFPDGHSVRSEGWVYFANPFPSVRVKDEWAGLVDTAAYEALVWDEAAGRASWQGARAPMTQEKEAELVRGGSIDMAKARYQTMGEDGKLVVFHRASVRWNPFLKAWLLVGNRMGGDGQPSLLGEVYVTSAPTIEGPWGKAVKVATHPTYSFYNPVHHEHLDEEGGRVIYFQGTYSAMFSGNQSPVPRYDYNQMLYRLDLKALDGMGVSP
jgi:hypothetical protein